MKIKVEEIGGNKKEISGAFSLTDLYIGFLEDMLSITAPKKISELVSDSKLEDLVVIRSNHTLKENSFFTNIRAIQESVILETTQIGLPTMSSVNQNKLTVKILGSKAEILGFKRLCKGRELIVIAMEYSSGEKRQLGSKSQPCWLDESSSKIEPVQESENTTTLIFKDKQLYDAPYYLGDLSGIAEYFKSDTTIITADRIDITSDIDKKLKR